MANTQIDFQIGLISPNHKFFDYLNDDDKREINHDIKNGLTHGVMGKIKDNETFAAFIDNYGDCIHIREVGGKFPKYIGYLETYCMAIAKYVGASTISFCTKIKGVEIIGEKMGYKKDDNGEFIKELI